MEDHPCSLLACVSLLLEQIVSGRHVAHEAWVETLHLLHGPPGQFAGSWEDTGWGWLLIDGDI